MTVDGEGNHHHFVDAIFTFCPNLLPPFPVEIPLPEAAGVGSELQCPDEVEPKTVHLQGELIFDSEGNFVGGTLTINGNEVICDFAGAPLDQLLNNQVPLSDFCSSGQV
jgi:hypothetical protein